MSINYSLADCVHSHKALAFLLAMAYLLSCEQPDFGVSLTPNEISVRANTLIYDTPGGDSTAATKAPVPAGAFPAQPFVMSASHKPSGGSTSTYFSGMTFSQSGDYWFPSSTKYWPKGGQTMFLAYSAQGLSLSPSWNANAATGFTVSSMPDNRSQQTDIMYAGTGLLSQSTGAVSLTFKHAQSLLLFTGASNVAYNSSTNVGVTVTGITMSALRYGGSFSLSQDEDGTVTPTWSASTTGAATAYSGTGNLSTSATDLGTGFMVYPQSPVAITINYTLHNGKDASGNAVNLTRNHTFTPSGSWAAGTSYTYAISFTEGEISVSASLGAWEAASQPWFFATGSAVSQKGANFNFSSSSPMWWRLDGSSSYEQLVYEEGTWGNSVKFSTQEYFVTVTAANSNYTVSYETKAPPVDLSLKDIWGGATLRNTANTYVVREAGVYLVPLVYGNAVKDGAVNAAAYTNIGGTEHVNFVNHNGTNITSPYIESHSSCTAGSAGLLWCTAQGALSDFSVVSVDGEPCRFLKFRCSSIPANNGVAVIYVKDTSGNVMWSWALWLTTDVLSTVSYNGYDILDENLCSIWLTRTTGSSRKMTNTYYQWGRKDPFPPASNNNVTTCLTVYDENGTYTNFANPSANASKTIANAIRLPYSYFTPYSNDWQGGNNRNLWNAAISQVGNSSEDFFDAVKTVYDPCPAGFMVPSGYLLNQITPGGNTARTTSYGVYGGTSSATIYDLWFPYSSYYYGSGNIYKGNYHYMWSYSLVDARYKYNKFSSSYSSSRHYVSSQPSYGAYSIRPVKERHRTAVGLTISPSSLVGFSGGYSYNFSAICQYSDGSEENITSKATWSADGLVTNSGGGSFTTGNVNGTTSIHASYTVGGVTVNGSASFTLRDRIVNSIELSVYDDWTETWSSSSAKPEAGHSQNYRMRVVYEDGEAWITNGFNLTSSNSSVISASGSSSSAINLGSANITATFGGKTSNTINMTVVPVGEYKTLIEIEDAYIEPYGEPSYDGWAYYYDVAIWYYDWLDEWKFGTYIKVYRARYVNGNLDTSWRNSGLEDISSSCTFSIDDVNRIYGEDFFWINWYPEEGRFLLVSENVIDYMGEDFWIEVFTPFGDYDLCLTPYEYD